MSPARTARRWMSVGVALAVPALFLFRRVLFGGETFVERDLESYHRAGKAILVRLLAETPGLPMWNPYLASGQPFAANPANQLFHPLTWLFAVLPFEWAFRLHVVVPVLLAGPAMAFLLLTLGRSRAAALFGAISWAYGGYLLSTTNLLPSLMGAVAGPVLLAFAVRIARGPSPADVAGLGLSLGWIALSGEAFALAIGAAVPAALLHGFVARGALGARPRRRPAFARSAASLAAAVALGLTIGAGTLLPGSLLFRKTVRAEGLTADAALWWSMPPERALELFTPHVLGHVKSPLHETYWGTSRYAQEKFPFLYSLYPGLLVLAAAAAAWWRRPSVEHGWAAVAVLGALLAIGRYGFLWPLAREAVPLLGGFRFPEKFALLLVLGVTVAGSAGFDLLLRRRRAARAAATTVLAVAALAGLAMAFSLLDLPSLYPAASSAGRDELLRLARLDGWTMLATAVAGLAALLVLFRRGRRAGAALLTLVLGLDVTLRGPALLRSEPAAEIDAPPTWVKKVLARDDPDGRVFHTAQWIFDSENVWGYLTPPPMPAAWGLKLTLENDFDRTELRWSRDATEAARKLYRQDPRLLEPILERRGVTALVRLHRGTRIVPGGFVSPPGLDSPLDVDVYVEKARLAFLAGTIRTARDADGWAREMRALGVGDLRGVVADESGPPLPASPGRGEVVRVASRPGRIEVDLRCDGPEPCFLAVAETWDEHWSARVDGKDAAIRRTDLSLMGVPVATGKHAVVLSYDDPSVRIGGSLSAGGALAGLGLVLVDRRRRARSRPASPVPASPREGGARPPDARAKAGSTSRRRPPGKRGR